MTITTYEAVLAAHAEIDASIATLKIQPNDPMTLVQTPPNRLKQVITIFRAVRPLLATVAKLPIPASWRAAVQLFVVALDGLAGEVASAEFKAGKDL